MIRNRNTSCRSMIFNFPCCQAIGKLKSNCEPTAFRNGVEPILMIDISVKDEELNDWLQLLMMAKKMGLSIEEIRNFLQVTNNDPEDAPETRLTQ